MNIKRYEKVIVTYNLNKPEDFTIAIIEPNGQDKTLYTPCIPHQTVQEIYDTVLYALHINRYAHKILSIDEFGNPIYDILFYDTADEKHEPKHIVYLHP